MSNQVTRQWHEVCALLMTKMEATHVVITEDDFNKTNGFISAEARADGLHIRLIDSEEAHWKMLLQCMPPGVPN